MPLYGDAKREYQRRWIAARRSEWIDQNGPCVDCGGCDRLEIDHVDPRTKEFKISTIWSRKEEVRLKELAKCVVRCHDCHLSKTTSIDSEHIYSYGLEAPQAVRSEEDILDMRKRYWIGLESSHKIASDYGLNAGGTYEIIVGQHFPDVELKYFLANTTRKVSDKIRARINPR